MTFGVGGTRLEAVPKVKVRQKPGAKTGGLAPCVTQKRIGDRQNQLTDSVHIRPTTRRPSLVGQGAGPSARRDRDWRVETAGPRF